MPHSAAADLGLHCLPMSPNGMPGLYGFNNKKMKTHVCTEILTLIEFFKVFQLGIFSHCPTRAIRSNINV